MIFHKFLAVFLSGFFATAVVADIKPTKLPMKAAGATTINAEELIDLASRHPNLIIIDARISADRQLGFISDSISLPDIDTDCDSLAKVTANKSQPMVFYCNGVKCGRSLVSIKAANSCGYTTMYWFRGGYAEWTDKNYPTEKQ